MSLWQVFEVHQKNPLTFDLLGRRQVSGICLCIYSHERMEVIDSVLFSQSSMDFESFLEKIFKQLEPFRFPVKRGHRCRDRLWQFGNSVNVVMEICSIFVVCQLLKGH